MARFTAGLAAGGLPIARPAQVLRHRLPSLRERIDELEEMHRLEAEACATEAAERRVVAGF